MTLISVVGPGVCGRTLVTYLLARELAANTRYSILTIDLDYRLKKSSLEVLLSEFRSKYGLYNYEDGKPLPIIPISEKIFLLPPGFRERKLDIELARLLIDKIIPSVNCDITICDCSISVEIPMVRYLLAYSDIIINIQTMESYIELYDIIRCVDPKPKIINIRNIVTRRSKDSPGIEIPLIKPILNNIHNIKKRQIYRNVIKKIRPIIDRVMIYLSNIEEILKIRRRILLEELLVW